MSNPDNPNSKSQEPINTNVEKNRERELNENYTWGEGLRSEYKYSKDWCCQNDECEMYGVNLFGDKFDQNIVGVCDAPRNLIKANKNYLAICRCPSCENRFYFHLDNITVKRKSLLGK